MADSHSTGAWSPGGALPHELAYFAGPLGSRAKARADDAWQASYERAADMDVPVEQVAAPGRIRQVERLEVLATELHEFLFSIRGKSDEQAGRELRTWWDGLCRVYADHESDDLEG